jgi:methylmalonyl-CoA mutase cobalamin-binding domain/chain
MQNLSMKKRPDVDGGYRVNPSDTARRESWIELIREKVNQFAARKGRRPRVLVSHIGPGGQRRTLNQIATTFARWGFDVDVGTISQLPHQAALTAIENDVHMVCLFCDPEYQLQVGSELIDVLRAHNCEDILVAFFCDTHATGNRRPTSSAGFATVGFYPATAGTDITSILEKLSR